MTMACPMCNTLMVWLNGSICHDPLVKNYRCIICDVRVNKQSDGSLEIIRGKGNILLHKTERSSQSVKPGLLPYKDPGISVTKSGKRGLLRNFKNPFLHFD